MDTGVFFVFLTLFSALASNVAADWPLIDTMFLRVYSRSANNSYTDFSLKDARKIVALLDRSKTIDMYIHGYLENVEMDTVKIVTKTLLEHTNDNVMSLDYSKIGVVYPVSVEYVPQIGKALAKAIDDMAAAGMNATAVHLMGLSLGGQICGHTGRNTAVKVSRITGLDPAGPLFVSGYLTKGDALFVCIIHSDMGAFGIDLTSGNVDFKPNFGHRVQPGCIQDVPKTRLTPGVCSHERSWAFFVESIKNRSAFPSIRCNTDSDFKNGNCDANSIIPMGYGTPTDATGVHYCQTNPQMPYSKGTPGTEYKPLI